MAAYFDLHAPEVTKVERTIDMTELNIQAITEMGCCVYTTITVSRDYTMNEVVKEVKRLGYNMFRLTDTMKRFAKVH